MNVLIILHYSGIDWRAGELFLYLIGLLSRVTEISAMYAGFVLLTYLLTYLLTTTGTTQFDDPSFPKQRFILSATAQVRTVRIPICLFTLQLTQLWLYDHTKSRAILQNSGHGFTPRGIPWGKRGIFLGDSIGFHVKYSMELSYY